MKGMYRTATTGGDLSVMKALNADQDGTCCFFPLMIQAGFHSVSLFPAGVAMSFFVFRSCDGSCMA